MVRQKIRPKQKGPCAFCIRNELADSIWRALLGATDIATHAIVLGVFLATIWILDKLLQRLWSDGDKIFFKGMGLFEVHLDWILNAADAGLLTVFSVKSVQILWRLYSHRESQE